MCIIKGRHYPAVERVGSVRLSDLLGHVTLHLEQSTDMYIIDCCPAVGKAPPSLIITVGMTPPISLLSICSIYGQVANF